MPDPVQYDDDVTKIFTIDKPGVYYIGSIDVKFLEFSLSLKKEKFQFNVNTQLTDDSRSDIKNALLTDNGEWAKEEIKSLNNVFKVDEFFY